MEGLLLIGFLFLLGLFWGSFLHVVADRLINGESIFFGRSHCENCKKVLTWKELFPVISFALQKGKCTKCKMSLSYWYPFSELLTGVLVVLVFLLYTTAPVSYLLLMYALLSLLIIIFLIDAKYGLIPFPLVVSTTGLAFLLSLIYPERSLLDSIIAGSVIGGFFFLLFALTRGKGMGFGDVVYAFFMGFLLGLPQAVSALYIAFLTGAAVALILVLLGRKKLKGGTIAFGPFLIIGTIVALFWGDILLAYALQFLS